MPECRSTLKLLVETNTSKDHPIGYSRNPTVEHWPLMLLVCALVLAALGGDPTLEELQYRRVAIQQGELWRALSGHLVHAGPVHLAMNLTALLLVWSLYPGTLAGLQGLALLAWLMAGTSIGLYFTEPSLQWYVGLSGVLHGLVLVAGWRLIRERAVLGASVLLLLAAKLVAETLMHESATARLIGVPVIEHAHLCGAGAGALAMVTLAAGRLAGRR